MYMKKIRTQNNNENIAQRRQTSVVTFPTSNENSYLVVHSLRNNSVNSLNCLCHE